MIRDSLIKKILREATTDSDSRGSYTPPLQPGLRDFENKLSPYNIPVSDYKSPLVQYDSYDHEWSLNNNKIKKLERTAKKVTDFIKHHPDSTFTDEDGGIINQTPSGKNKKTPEIVPIKRNKNKLNEITTTTTAGEYSGPQELGIRNWTDNELGAFRIKSDIPINNQIIKKFIKKNVLKTVGGWEPRKGKFQIDTGYAGEEKEKKVDKKGVIDNEVIDWYKNFYKSKLKENSLNEDLAVWFGKKKKPKGSSQPKGPWVDICRKVDGKHPPCGRSDTSKGSYPKCRAAGVAGKMSDSQKRSACQQKRRAEKQDTQSGKGQKPIMTSYKPKKKLKEDMRQQIITLTESDIMKIVRRVLKEQNVGDDVSGLGKINLKCIAYNKLGTYYEREFYNYIGEGTVKETNSVLGFNIVKDPSSNPPSDGIAGDPSQPVFVEIDDMTQDLKEYLISQFPDVDWDKTILGKKIMYVKGLVSGFKFACSTQQGTDPRWEDFFTNTAYQFLI